MINNLVVYRLEKLLDHLRLTGVEVGLNLLGITTKPSLPGRSSLLRDE